MWTLENLDQFHGRFKKFAKKNPGETAQVMDNLIAYQVSLDSGVKPMQLTGLTFVRNEGTDVHAIDQKPLGKGFIALRLYVHPEEETEIIHVITLGDKKQQPGDIKDARQYVVKLRKNRQKKAS